MKVSIEGGWKSLLEPEFDTSYFSSLVTFVRKEYQDYQCYPKGSDVFAAFAHCPLNKVRVVILGQDPYHGPDQANGLSFSVRSGVRHPPSLVNIFREIQDDTGAAYPESGDLTRWAEQGVLLLNAVMTVRASSAGSHRNKGWESFTDAVIRGLSDSREELIFLLWGGYAKKKIPLIDLKKHHVLTSGHPSPLSANRGYWFGNKHFSQANNLLRLQNSTPIIW
ncbi:uracil-DNA glycosylase [Robiginitalea sp.]|uniref:uracil-DNA glycosylase n=1 Tax=Robiginitalea sp. TaxID=1902411 RepID=UPI003C706933